MDFKMNAALELLTIVRNRLNDESGTAIMEWALVASIVAIAGVGVMTMVGSELQTTFGDIINALGGTYVP